MVTIPTRCLIFDKNLEVETDNIYSSAETGSLIENTRRWISHHKIEASQSGSVMSEDVAGQIGAVTHTFIKNSSLL